MKNAVILTILGLVLTATAVHSAEQNTLPHACTSADFTETGRPVMFPPRNGLSMGISVPHGTFQMGEPIGIYVWVNNQTDDERALLSCSMWTEWGVDVYDSEWHRVKTQSEKKQEHNPAAKLHSDLQECFRNIALQIPPHSCSPLHDMGNVRVDLSKEYTLSPGSYFITQKKLTLPLSGLSVTVVGKNLADGFSRSPTGITSDKSTYRKLALSVRQCSKLRCSIWRASCGATEVLLQALNS